MKTCQHHPLILSSILLMAIHLMPSMARAEMPGALIQNGIDKVTVKDFEGAVRDFEAAIEQDHGNPKAHFLLGAALNRLGKFSEARDHLLKSHEWGHRHKEYDFELGWSLLGIRDWKSAVEHLERYESSHPGRGQTSEFLGRAYLGLGEVSKAKEKLHEAIDRDSNLKPIVNIYLAKAEILSDNSQAAAQQLNHLLDTPLVFQEDNIFRMALISAPIRDEVLQIENSKREQKGWNVSLQNEIGYNNNVVALNDSARVPDDISSRGSIYYRTVLGADYLWRPATTTYLRGGYQFQAIVNEAVPIADLRDHYGYLTLYHEVDQDLRTSLTASEEFTEVGGLDFRNKITLRPAVSYHWVDSATVELAYTGGYSDYAFGVSRTVQDRDAWSHSVTLINYFRIPLTQARAKLGVIDTFNLADGSDYDYHSFGIIAGGSHPLGWKFLAEVTLTHSWDTYAHLNSLAGPTGFLFAREDEVDVASLRISRPINKYFTVFTDGDYRKSSSNITVFEYDQLRWSVGGILKF